MPATDIRIGYARCSHLTQKLQSQLDALEAHGIPRQDLLREGLHLCAGTAEVRGRAGNVPPDQGPRPAPPRERRVGGGHPADLVIPTGKRKGHNPSVASIYRALAEHARRERFPETIEQAHAEFAAHADH
jgi:hypothetical protein